ncbi:MAG: bacillithiol biosynthesis cysteine-adding enzyme BshC [candidate division KSB1 bacterium]|nr:bacillithiol biosynthesis cysteine-adding enzyme BshC [candidate division KSB1 bacterium]MDZ7364631.1 bacillithiol biosynthesis cysteine-adding enzyme BshC [candidate division KSB1 bacterium]MDZ7402621.1 bacillithiol biosynthesis cysteine-adding enzyme BshC [candidate division KSB1 bacterium]
MKIPFSHVPGAGRLFLDYLENFDRLAEFFAVDYRSRAALLAQCDLVAQRDYPRPEMAKILDHQNRRWGAGEATTRHIAALEKSGSLAVVTGQQVGIFGGPLYTLYKALTCLKLAESLSARLGREVTPIFWLAADDDDLNEVNQLKVMNRENELELFSCVFDTEARRPVSQIHLTDNIASCHQALAAVIPDTEFKTELLHALQEAYHPGATLPEAFARWLMHLLGHHGLVVMNPADAAIKRLAAPLFEREIQIQSPSTMAALQTIDRLAARDYSPQVSLRPDRLNLFYVRTQRHTLEQRLGAFFTTDGAFQFSHGDLLRHVQRHPENFSPNVMLRPVMQDFLLPTVAYIAGPAEIAYFAQLRGVYEAFAVPMPAIFPRYSMTLLEKKIARVLEKYDLQITDFWTAEGGAAEELISRAVKREADVNLFAPVAAARDVLSRQLAELKTRATALDATLGGFIEKEQGKIFHQLESIEKKLLQAAKRQDETLAQQITKAVNALYPNRHLQERELSFLSFLCKYGRGLMQKLYEQIDLTSFQHQVVEL